MNQKGWLVALLALLLGGVGGWWFLCRDHGGHGSGAPKFRRIRFINVSGNDVKKVKVSRILPTASELWFLETPVPKDGDSGDSMGISRALNDPLANSTKIKVEVWVDVAGVERALAAVELDTGATNQLFTDLSIVFDNHWDTSLHPNDFQVTLFGYYAADDVDAWSTREIQATRTP